MKQLWKRIVQILGAVILCTACIFPAVSPGLTTWADDGGMSSSFYTEADVGDGDLFFYTYLNEVYTPAFCLDFGKYDPQGKIYTSAAAVNALGYVMKNGYPNSLLGTSEAEARYATQIAVFIIQGYDPYAQGTNNAGGAMASMATVASNMGWGNAVEKGIALANQAKANATDADAKYAHRWNAPESSLQNMVTPSNYASGSLKLYKTSGTEHVTSGNNCYSYEGAEYTVYSDEECNTTVGTLTVGADGNTNVIEVETGTYYIRETKAPEGFCLSERVIPVDVSKDQVFTAEDSEEAKLYYGGLEILKKSSKEEKDPAPLSGVQFTIRYFDNTEGDTSGAPLRTWVIETKYEQESGVYRAALDAEHIVQGFIGETVCEIPMDALYLVDGMPVLPLGTIEITETKTAPGYLEKGKELITESGTVVTDEPLVALISEENGEVVLDCGSLLTAVNTPEDKPEIPEQKKQEIPKTGDREGFLLWGIVCGTAFLSVSGLIVSKRMKKNRRMKNM